ncbi:MAG: GTP-binding protein [bacterium]|nr:GTP-binding protein [bacterium]
MEIRNIAIIAHVDHGKTTLTDAILKQTGMVGAEAASLDSNDLEKERGITIYSKNASVFYRGTKINIVDTPGHADFGSEVERVLRSIDSVLLIVDAQEGPMPQTRFVLKKSLELGLKPIVVINKIDKPAANPDLAQEQVFELFLDLGATDEQLDFTVVYAIGKQGIAKEHLSDDSENLNPLLDVILLKVHPAPAKIDVPFRFQPFNLGYDNFLGRLAIGRIHEGTVRVGGNLILKKNNPNAKESKINLEAKLPIGSLASLGFSSGRVTKLFTFEGLKRKEVSEAFAGDIVMIAGFPTIDIGETLCDDASQKALPAIMIDEPTISLNFLVNSSPFAGREGKFVTNQQLRERLERELQVNVGLRIDFFSDSAKVYGRGELHIAILLENMRREGYEVQVSNPQVIIKEIEMTDPVKYPAKAGVARGEFNRVKLEPFEEATVDAPEIFSGAVIEKIGKRKGVMMDMKKNGKETRMIFEIPTRGLLGYRSEFIVDTKGEGILCSRFIGYKPYVGEIKKRAVGSMISMALGKALGFSLYNLQERGTLYIGSGTEVYEGMVIGNTSKGEEMSVNPIKGKQLSNMRASGTDEAIQLIPPQELTVEKGLEVMAEDEYLEITPASVRLRKQELTEIDRRRASRKTG